MKYTAQQGLFRTRGVELKMVIQRGASEEKAKFARVSPEVAPRGQ